jgi:hypothetical protein
MRRVAAGADYLDALHSSREHLSPSEAIRKRDLVIGYLSSRPIRERLVQECLMVGRPDIAALVMCWDPDTDRAKKRAALYSSVSPRRPAAIPARVGAGTATAPSESTAPVDGGERSARTITHLLALEGPEGADGGLHED